ncbi:MAG: hypothetical protein AB7J35_04585 [Dehalococcoidia bacterium]
MQPGFEAHDGFVEIQLPLSYDRLVTFPPAILDHLYATGALLYNFEAVEAVRVDPFIVASRVEAFIKSGIRVAMLASEPAWFGVGRQIVLLARAEPEQAAAFTERDLAVMWLLNQSPAAD